MVYTEAKSLAILGFNPNERITSADSFQRQLESYALHVVEDLPVSNRYSYYLNERGKIFIDKNFQTELFIDEQERGGFAKSGTIKAIEMARNNPGKVVIFYSPPGPVAFEKGTRYDQVKNYPDGQLYLLVGNNKNQIDCLAISVGQENEEQVLDIFLGERINRTFNDQVTKIIYYLNNPRLIDKNIDDLIVHLSNYDQDTKVYTNVHGNSFVLGEVIQMIILGWEGNIKPQINLDEILFPKIWGNDLPKLPFSIGDLRTYGEGNAYSLPPNFYLKILDAYTDVYGNNYNLGGSCGGSVYSKEKKSLFENWSIKEINPLATSWRSLTNSESSDRYDDYECPSCHQKIKGELKNQPDTWHTNCPHCGYSFNCKNGAKNFSAN